MRCTVQPVSSPEPLHPERWREARRRYYDYYSHLAQGAPQAGVVPDRLVEKFAIAGMPEEVLEQVARLEDVGIDQIGLVPHGPDRLSQVRMFAEHVVPRL